MTTPELCELAGVSQYRLQLWLETGLIEAKTTGIQGGGRRFEFAGQLERARLLKELACKGVPLARLAASDLAFDGQARWRQAAGMRGRPVGDRRGGQG
jgi:DNA-binding transcriptional MerR regulator